MTTQTGQILNRRADQLESAGIVPFDAGPAVLVGSSLGDDVRDAYSRLGWGRMWSSGVKVDPYLGEPWGLDNGAFSAFANGGEFPTDKFVRRVEAAREVADERDAPPRVAVVPDIVQGGMDSLEFSLSWLDRVRDMAPDWDWYLAVQDGFTREGVEDVVEEFDGLFLGGGDAMKYRAGRWCGFAHAHGLRFHYARAGTPKKLTHAFQVGADSLDSAFPVRDPNRLSRFVTLCAELQGGAARLS